MDYMKGYLESINNAGLRTRFVIIVLLVAFVLGLVTFLNSWKYQ